MTYGRTKRKATATKRGKAARRSRVARARGRVRSYARYRLAPAVAGANFLFPETKLVKFTYNQRVLLDAADVSTVKTKIFRMNSMYDPDTDVSITNGSHQPFMFDQLSVFYGKYCVMGAKVTITANAADNSVLQNTNLVVAYFEDAAHSDYPTNPDALREKRYPGKKFCQLGSAQNTKLHPRTLRLNFSAKKFFNVQSMKDNLTIYGAATNSNPMKTANLYIHTINAYDGIKLIDPKEIFLNVNIEYTALMYDKISVAQS